MQKFKLTLTEDSINIRAVKLVAAEPESADLERLTFLRQNKEPQLEDVVYLVKVYMTGVPITSTGMMLFVGKELISKYWAFNGGIYFIVYNPDFFVTHKNDFIRYSLDGGISIQQSEFQLPSLPLVSKATSFKLLAANAASHIALPTKQSALSE